ncbi:helix-turn-helix domain-containing protein [Paraburkholderia azotifigens]|uniref:Helix-turn-helix domain-containing protein n=1 Tax=Paraburkholderia azotifigens TaxID=2057004 RepID=A0A5C6V0C5_9BURK|nr:helix-turn-helix domain-containing protein [Paraburkholderia azotifigens]
MKSAKRDRTRKSVTSKRRRSDELTVAEASRLLHVSRTYLTALIDEGKFLEVHTTRRGRRRISRAEVLAYKEQIVKAQADGLERMIRASERMGLYDGEMRELSLHRK